MYDVDGGMRTKVLAELMHHMIGLHGKSTKNPMSHTGDATLPNPDGSAKHEPKGKIEGVSIISAKPTHESDRAVSMNEHGGEGDHVEEHALGDLFGRKKKSMMEF